jgi:prevent-host-death family protein
MRTFPSSDLKQILGDVLNAASREPVTITKHNKPRYVLMSVEDYDQRVRKDERRVIATGDMPVEHLVMLETALEKSRSEP